VKYSEYLGAKRRLSFKNENNRYDIGNKWFSGYFEFSCFTEGTTEAVHIFYTPVLC
jgi:hypothetical protein